MKNDLKRVTKRREITIHEIELFEKKMKDIQFEVTKKKCELRAMTDQFKSELAIEKERHKEVVSAITRSFTKKAEQMNNLVEKYESTLEKEIDSLKTTACKHLSVIKKDVDKIIDPKY